MKKAKYRTFLNNPNKTEKEIEQYKKELIDQGISIAGKLAKLPTKNEIKAFICSSETVYKYFGSIADFHDELIKKQPSLENLTIPVKVQRSDIEAYRLKLKGNNHKKNNESLLKEGDLFEYIAQFAESVFQGKISPVNPKKSNNKLSRALNLTLSDLHFGSDINSEETGYLSYSKREESRRFAAIVKQTIDYKPQYRKETELHVNLLGDIIQHKLHDSQDAAPVAEQICRAIHLLSQGLAQLAENFPKVKVRCSTGNHGRDLNRHQSRATSGKWDSVETVIYYSLKQILSKYKNIEFEIPKTPYVIYDVFGHKVFATHGDGVLNPGNPGKSLNIAKLEQQLNRINATLRDEEEVKVAIVGHTHCASISQLSNGVTMVTNGCLPPVDAFAVSLGILENRASQTLFEMVHDYAVGDIRFIKVGPREDEDKSLDKLIKPFESL